MNKQTVYLLGRPFSPFYSLIMRVRAFFYRTGVFRVTRVGVPVISVGNLTMGGSGKTPVVQYIARFLQEEGRRPAIVSRGYGGSARGRVNIVSDGEKVILDASSAGDEPRFLAETLPGVPVLTGKARSVPAARSVELGSDILVLDDGFQHMALERNLDLVLFNADFLAGNSVVFPGGDLREPVKALNRCHGFVMTGVCNSNKERAGQFADLLRQHFPEHPVFMSYYRPSSLLLLNSDGAVQVRPVDELNDVDLLGFSGIAHPNNFRNTLSEQGYSIRGFRSFADHYDYAVEDVDDIVREAKELRASACITTEKDLVKLAACNCASFPLYALRMEVEFDNDFKEFLLASIRI